MFNLVLDKVEKPYKVEFPGLSIDCEGAVVFKADIDGREIPVTIAFAELEVYGSKRKKYFVIVKNSVEVEFVASDNYDRTGYLVAVLKKPGREERYKVNEKIPEELSRFRIVYHKDYIRSGEDRLAILVDSYDFKSMIDYALTRARIEGRM